MEEQANRPLKPPPPQNSKMKLRNIFLSFIGEGGGGDKFPISSVQDVLSVIVAGLWILHCILLGFSLCGWAS